MGLVRSRRPVKPVEFEGCTYASVAAWTRAVFPDDGAARQRLTRVHRLHPELTLEQQVARARTPWSRGLFTVNGRRVVTVAAVAEELGLCAQGLYQRVYEGRRLEDVVARRGGVVVAGRRFPSRRAACEALQVNYFTVAGVMHHRRVEFADALLDVASRRGASL